MRRKCKYKIDESFFEEVNTPEKAYILGLMYADGNNYMSNHHSKACLTLKRSDSYLLDQVNKILGSERPLQIAQGNSILNISGKKFSLDLCRLGCVPNKSLILTYPTPDQVPNEFTSHFIRGYFDGDGSVVNHSRTTLGVSIAGSHKFLGTMADILRNSGVSCSVYCRGNISELRIFRKASVKTFYGIIYHESSIMMIRKYDRFVNHYKKEGLI